MIQLPAYLEATLGEALGMFRDAAYNALRLSGRPSAIFRPHLSIDGNQWCALYGDNLQDGVAGFGDSPEAAYEAFDKAWREPLPSLGGGRGEK